MSTHTEIILQDAADPAAKITPALMPATAQAVEELARNMASAARMRTVGRMCLLAALMRLSDEIDEVCDVHAAAVANAGGTVGAEMQRLKSASAEALRALKAEG